MLVSGARRLRFPLEEEHLFWQYFREKSMVVSRRFSYFTIAFLVFYLFMDTLNFQPYSWQPFLLRLANMLPHGVYGLISLRQQRRERSVPDDAYLVASFICSSIVQNCILAIAPTESIAYHHYWVANCIFIFVYFTGCRTRIPWAIGASLITIRVWNIVAIGVQNWLVLFPTVLLSCNLFLFSLMGICTFIAYNIEYAYRLNFVHRYIAETLNHHLEAAQVFKTRMVSLVAHDLRNPLSSIILGSKLALSNVATDHEVVQNTLQDILTLSHGMNSLIDDILDTTALESGVMRLQKEHLNATHLVQTTCGRYQAMAAEKQQWLETQLEDECLVYADGSKLQQVIENLLSNAIKYSPLGKPISVRLQKHSVKVRLFVQDQGSGLTEEDKKQIFGLFVKLSARPTGNESSNGVGLSNVKHLVELHDGTVSVESRADEGIPGATFIVELPAAAYEMV